jgi:hypothetical protein
MKIIRTPLTQAILLLCLCFTSRVWAADVGTVSVLYPPDNRPCTVFSINTRPGVLFGISMANLGYQEQFAAVLTAFALGTTITVFSNATVACGSFVNVTNVGISP